MHFNTFVFCARSRPTNEQSITEFHNQALPSLLKPSIHVVTVLRDKISCKSVWLSPCLLAVLGSQGILPGNEVSQRSSSM